MEPTKKSTFKQPKYNALIVPLPLDNDLQDVTRWMMSNTFVDGATHKQAECPRFGLLSLKLQNVPCYFYGHPAFKEISDKAFTDGVHLFICADFYKKLYDESIASDARDFGVEILILQGITSMLFPEESGLSINAALEKEFPHMSWCKTLLHSTPCFGAENHSSRIDLKNFINTLEDYGMNFVLKGLLLPHSGDPQQEEKINQLIDSVKKVDARIAQQANLQKTLVGTRYPGCQFAEKAAKKSTHPEFRTFFATSGVLTPLLRRQTDWPKNLS